MSPMVFVVLAAAATGCTLVGAGLALIGRPDDRALIRAVERSRASASDTPSPHGTRERIAAWASRQPVIEGFGPTLALADITMASLVSEVLTAGAVFALVGAALPVLFALAGMQEAAYLVPFGAIGGGIFAIVVVVDATRQRAEKRRRQLRQSFAGYISLTALAMAGSMGLESAIHAAARVSDDWVFVEIRGELATIALTRRPVYAVFEVLGARYGESDLISVASTLRQSLESGTGLRTTLEAKADSLRNERMAALEAEAGKLTQKMFIPSSIMFFGYLIILGYPAISHIVGIL